MPRTLKDIIDRVRVVTGDKSSAQFVDADIARWATDAQLRLMRNSERGQSEWTGTSVKGQNSYAVTGGFLMIREVFYNGSLVMPMTEEELNQYNPNRLISPTTQIGTPTLYWLTKDTVNLYITPDTNGLPIYVKRIPRPTDLVVSSDPLTVPDEQLETLVMACLQRAKEWEEDFEGAAYFRSELKDRTAEDSYQGQVQTTDSYPSIRSADGDDW